MATVAGKDRIIYFDWEIVLVPDTYNYASGTVKKFLVLGLLWLSWKKPHKKANSRQYEKCVHPHAPVKAKFRDKPPHHE